MSGALLLLAAAVAAATLVPCPRRPVPGRDQLCLALTGISAAAYTAAVVLPFVSGWGAAPRCLVAGTVVFLAALWLAKAPDEDDGADGGGGSDRGGGPDPGGDPFPALGGPQVDWERFDELRATWERVPAGA